MESRSGKYGMYLNPHVCRDLVCEMQVQTRTDALEAWMLLLVVMIPIVRTTCPQRMIA